MILRRLPITLNWPGSCPRGRLLRLVKRNAPLWDREGQYFIYIGRIKYVGDLKKYNFYGIIIKGLNVAVQ
jgi:hypothetical protein